MNVNLGTPYESLMQRLIEKGYAGNQTELIRQALVAYERQVDEEEVLLVRKAVEHEMQLVESGKLKIIPFEKIKAKYLK
ncbi:MAG TPA: hypothetical protein VJI71_02745 [Candidatus Norongarragalinales archaeon]|nr:hypothetical protein [Candidatus Norongarragalinales archaeon]